MYQHNADMNRPLIWSRSRSQTGNEVSQDSLLLHGPFARKPKRIRTAFSPSQLLRLERAFEKNHYVVGAERKQLANSLSLSETQVRTPLPKVHCLESHLDRNSADLIRNQLTCQHVIFFILKNSARD